MISYLILSLATWRITSLLVTEFGPGNIFERLRYRLGVRYDVGGLRIGNNIVAEAFTCLWCLSLWVGIVLTILFWLWPGITWLAMPFAFSTIAILIDKAANHG